MPLFSLTNINFDAPKGPTGPLTALGINTKFDYSTYKYPIDLGSTDKNHYMMINILEQRKTTFDNPGSGTSGFSTANTNASKYGTIGGIQVVNDFGKLATEAARALNQIPGVATVMSSINKTLTNLVGDKTMTGGALISIKEQLQGSLESLANGSSCRNNTC